MFQTIFVAPLYNPFIFFVGITGGSVGWAIIILTVLIRALLYGVYASSIKTQMGMQAIQGDLAEINKKYKEDPTERGKRTAALFKEKKVNPLSTFLGLFVQIIVFIALYQALFRQGLPNIATNLLYPFVHAPAIVDHFFLGINLLLPHNIPLALIVGITQYITFKLTLTRSSSATATMTPEQAQAQRLQQGVMLYTMPVIFAGISYTLPAGVGLYFAVSNAISVVQELLIRRELGVIAKS